MNRMTFPILLALLSFAAWGLGSSSTLAQTPLGDAPLSDSSGLFELLPFSYLPMEACGSFLTPPDQPFLLIRDSATFADLLEPKRFIGQCRDLELPQVDFSRYAVFGFDLFVDCNADIVIGAVRDTATHDCKVLVDVYYGGCRGMQMHSYWLLIPALAEGQGIRLELRDHEERRERSRK